MSKSKVTKTIAQINERIKAGKAVVVNAAEMCDIVRKLGKEEAAKEVDVVTTGTFSPMCSSGLLFNMGQPEAPTMRSSKIWINGVPCYGGIAAADGYLGATEMKEGDPLNEPYPGQFAYGGAHVIEDLVAGKSVHLQSQSYGTDCYPRRTQDRHITLQDLPYAELLNPRNCYQNYNAAVNLTGRIIYTYMGPLRPNMQNLNYATAGHLSPLFNDPYFRTIGMGTRIFLGGGVGYVIGAGTQHVASPQRTERGLPLTASGTLMLKGDLKAMKQKYIRGLSLMGYGCTLNVGVGIPIPILNEEMAWFTAVDNSDILMPIKDYGHDYPNCIPRILAHAPFDELMSGEIELMDKKVKTVPLTSYSLSLDVANELKEWIQKGEFLLTEPVEGIQAS